MRALADREPARGRALHACGKPSFELIAFTGGVARPYPLSRTLQEPVDDLHAWGAGAQGRERIDHALKLVLARHELAHVIGAVERVALVVEHHEAAVGLAREQVDHASQQRACVADRESERVLAANLLGGYHTRGGRVAERPRAG